MGNSNEIQTIVDNIIKAAKKDAIKAANVAIDEMYKESQKMYDSFIDQYYNYKTKSYIRHGETRPGTKRGINLYRGNKIEKENGDDPIIDILYDASDMEGYRRTSPDFVLESVMRGYRGVPWGQWNNWEGTYNGKYFSYTGTPKDAFDMLNEKFDDIASNIFNEEIIKLGW